MGISVRIPENSFVDEAKVKVLIHPYSGGTFEMPDGYELASPVYCIQPSNDINFTKDVILEIHHYANLQTDEDCKDMAFVSAPVTSQESVPAVHVFQKIDVSKSSFRMRNSIGRTILRHFSLFAIVRWIRNLKLGMFFIVCILLKLVLISKLCIGNEYSARLYRDLSLSLSSWNDLFCVCRNHPLYIKVTTMC